MLLSRLTFAKDFAVACGSSRGPGTRSIDMHASVRLEPAFDVPDGEVVTELAHKGDGRRRLRVSNLPAQPEGFTLILPPEGRRDPRLAGGHVPQVMAGAPSLIVVIRRDERPRAGTEQFAAPFAGR
jgi:hypothetical protein